MQIKLITKKNIEQYRQLIIPLIYDELLEDLPDDENDELFYLCLACHADPDEMSAEENAEADSDAAVAAVVVEMEDFGDLNLLSIFTLPEYRRKGYATAILQKAVMMARELYQFDEGEEDDDIVLKTLFRLPKEMEEDFAAFLAANGFTDFLLLEDADDPETEPGEDGEVLNIWSAYGEIHFY